MHRITTAHLTTLTDQLSDRDRAILADLFEAASRRGRPRDPTVHRSSAIGSSPFGHYAVDLIGPQVPGASDRCYRRKPEQTSR
jgi:hypothetical protein